jgi:hypothetical protein
MAQQQMGEDGKLISMIGDDSGRLVSVIGDEDTVTGFILAGTIITSLLLLPNVIIHNHHCHYHISLSL